MTPTASLLFLPPKEEEIFPGVLLMVNPSSRFYSPREDGQMQLYLVLRVDESYKTICVLEDDQRIEWWRIEPLKQQTLLVAFPEDTEEEW